MSTNMNRRSFLSLSAAAAATTLAACGGSGAGTGEVDTSVDPASLAFPLAETAELKGLTDFPVGTESEPNNRTIFKRLEEQTNVHINWKTIQSDQWGDKISLEMSNANTLPDFIFNARFGDTDLLKYAEQGALLNLEDLIDTYMPNLQKVFEQAPEYRSMCEDADGHIWALPWIEQLGYEKTAIQTVGNMPFINKWWLDFLKLDMPKTVDDFEKVLIAFRDNADALKKEFSIDGDIIPMSCILNDGDQDCYALINGFGEGYGDPDKGKHIAVTDDGEVICVANIAQVSMDDLIAGEGWVPLPALEADTKNITPQTNSYTSGFDLGRCVITVKCSNPPLCAAWLDQMYDPIQSAQNNWGTYGEDDEFDIFEMSENANGEPMLKHAPLGDASPVEVREAECVGGPLAILDSYYGVYVTCPDDAQYRLDWIKNIYTPDMNHKYCYPRVFMSTEDTKQVSNLQADIQKCINTFKSNSIMKGFDDAAWDKLQSDLEAYGLPEFLEIHQRYLTEYLDAQA